MSSMNEAQWDRIVRVVVGVVLLALVIFGVVSGVLAVVLAILGVVLAVTGLIGWCPLYAALGMRTNRA